MLVDNSVAELRYIADKFGGKLSVQNIEKWNHLIETYEK
jgi:predicted SpoU family rRNA methylase